MTDGVYGVGVLIWGSSISFLLFVCTGGDERLIVIGGFGRQQIPLSDVEEFNPKTSEWDKLPVSIKIPVTEKVMEGKTLDVK